MSPPPKSTPRVGIGAKIRVETVADVPCTPHSHWERLGVREVQLLDHALPHSPYPSPGGRGNAI